MKDIARMAHVSQPAVSAALNGKGSTKVSAEKREEILALVSKLNYTPNRTAQRLKGGASRTVGIFGVPYVSILEQALMLELSMELSKFGYNLLTCYGEPGEAAVAAVSEMLNKGVDGIIINTGFNPLEQMKTINTPYVLCPPSKEENFDVCIDHYSGVLETCRKLADEGRKSLGFLLLDSRNSLTPPTQEKFNGYVDFCQERELTVKDISITDLKYELPDIVRRIKELKIDTLLCQNDYVAARILPPILNSGIKVPEDLMIVGYDGLTLCELTSVPLATIVQPTMKMAKKVIEILMKRIKAKVLNPKPEQKMLTPYFYNPEADEKVFSAETFFKSDTFSTIDLNLNI